MAKNWQRDIATLAGGLALGVLGSRLLVPMIATARGAARGRAGHDPFELLIEDHRKIVGLLHEMENSGQAPVPYRMKLFLAIKRTLGKHAMAEEDVVYPLMHQEMHAVDESKHLYDEHADIKIHLFALEEMLKNGEDWTDRVRQLRGIIEPHIRQEEEVEFPKLRASLSQSKMTTAAAGVHREEALVQ
ncbi:MAG TPA: hemerythrin domain-containing protein [Bryobacteraceae bacterium]|nr:hemerythrin domain-containing protein [Bryobacteraceae bacterium]